MNSLVQPLTRLSPLGRNSFSPCLTFLSSLLLCVKSSLTMTEVYKAEQSHTPPAAPRKVYPTRTPLKHEGRHIRASSYSGMTRIQQSDPFAVGDIYVHPYMHHSTPIKASSPKAATQPPLPPAAEEGGTSSETATMSRLLWWKTMLTSAHPLMWVSLALSLIALVLGVPKDAAPILISRNNLRVGVHEGRHRIPLMRVGPGEDAPREDDSSCPAVPSSPASASDTRHFV